ncbi:MAG: hypothetical protein IJF63_03710, partial [Alistipes sp.]|nr:hypothetical protein [Alistipes sp.]
VCILQIINTNNFNKLIINSMKMNEFGVYVTPDFEIEVVKTEAGFALSFDPDNGTENFDSEDPENLC